MGYNISRFSVIRNKPQLDQLLISKCDIKFKTRDPRKLCYKLREALASAKEFDDLTFYPDVINEKYTFREESDAVVAEYNVVSPGIPVGEVAVSEDSGPVGRPEKSSKGTIDSARTMIDVIGGGVQGDKEGYVEVYFPNVILDESDQKFLWDWTQTTKWGFIDHQEKGLTLVKGKGFKDIVWRPEK
jgi:hypothetical protein